MLRESIGGVEKAFHETLRAAIESGELDDSFNPKDLARMLVAVSQGTALMGRVLETPTIPNSIGAAICNLLKKNRKTV